MINDREREVDKFDYCNHINKICSFIPSICPSWK